jgi:hypothetical protein
VRYAHGPSDVACTDDPSVLRIIGALLAEISERWQEKIYFDMGDYHEWVVERTAPKKGGTKRNRPFTLSRIYSGFGI